MALVLGFTVSGYSQTQEKPFRNPSLIYGTSFGSFFQVIYRQGQFEQMMSFTSLKSIERFGFNRILEFYQNTDFGYTIDLQSITKSDSLIMLNYDAIIGATRRVIRFPVIIENDTSKMLPSDVFKHQVFLSEWHY